MKQKLLTPQLKQSLLAVPAAALMLGAASGAQIGINFQDNWYGTAYAPVTADPALGIPLANWINAPSILNSGFTAFSTNSAFTLPGGGNFNMAWSCVNTYSLVAAIPADGDSQVIYGYLDDTGAGYSVTISGWRSFASDFTITTVASTDSGSDFMPVQISSKTETNTVQYLANFTPSFASGLSGISTVSAPFITIAGNDSITIKGLSKTNSQIRSCLAGIIINYTPNTSNPPLIESNPQTPAGVLYPGSSFILNSTASGAPTLAYQWRKSGVNIPGATFASYTNSSAVVGDTGTYDVVVTNAFGIATSATANVTIQNIVAPVITQAPVSQSMYASYPVTFTVAATGGSLSYQWKTNGVAVPGATGTSFSIASLVAANAGTYTVDVSNPVGPTASASATLVVKTPVSAYEAAVVGTKPAIWMRYGETGPITQDAAVNTGSLSTAGNGLYIGSVTHPSPGALVGNPSATAAKFSGGKITVPYNASINPAGTFSIECWFNPDNITSGNRVLIQSMVNGENSGNANDRNGWALRQSGADLQFLAGTDLGAPFYYYYTVPGAITAGVWNHVVVSYNGTVPSIYVNGVSTTPVVTRNDNVAMTQPEIDAIRIVPNTLAPLIIGDRGYGGWTFAGSIDEVAVYPSALSGTVVQSHYQNGTSASPVTPYQTLIASASPVEYLRLNDSTPVNVATNSGTTGATGNGNYADGGGQLGNPQLSRGTVGPRPPTTPGLEANNTAVSFTNGYVASQILPMSDSVTVTGWVNRQNPSSGGDLSWLAWLGDGGFHMLDEQNPGELRYHWKGGKWDWSSGLVVPEGVWTFCAIVIEPTKATIYMSDGNVLRSAVNDTTHAAAANTSPVSFGGNQPGNAGRTYIGSLDESCVYNRALTSSEINTLFLVGSGAPFNLQIVNGGMIEDTKPTGTPLHATGRGTVWLNSSTDFAAVTRTGVQQFYTTNSSQIRVPASADLDSTVGTFSFWMKVAAPLPAPGDEAAMLVDRRTSSGTVITLNDAGSIFVQCAGGANSLSGGYLPDENWHHVAVTYDQSATGVIEIYVDGILNASQANTAAWSWPVGQQLEIGTSHDGYWKRYDGQMDDFRIYNRVLNATEIATIFSSDALVDNAALKLRYNFGTGSFGKSVVWPFGTLLSSPVLGAGAVWTPVSGATAPSYPFLPTGPAQFFRATP